MARKEAHTVRSVSKSIFPNGRWVTDMADEKPPEFLTPPVDPGANREII